MTRLRDPSALQISETYSGDSELPTGPITQQLAWPHSLNEGLRQGKMSTDQAH